MGSNEQPLESTRQRLDKWLFFARMAKSRSLAQGYVQSGQVKVNGVTIRQPSHTVKAGDRLDIGFERMDRVLVVKSGGARRGPYEEAKLLYDDLTPPRDPSDRFSPLEQAMREPGSGRPTKKERRALDRFLSDSDGSKD
ncbi:MULTISPECIES: RNA-binding S4 domain-containing protein [Rhizobium/Agrobacterium group]|uniref:RNA-binding S4 domain-containing protein n=2 Tax=Agrobacterium tumefaciens complex TaxID=1183400 RepID=A0AAE6BM04_AGRTU|nr:MULTISPECIES: RNA-binding S4 domain-containing protein [Rhizobium/Agrobacterium group]MCA2375789.1 RNA-binding S4 domain-containing protein [Agrobacterium tomkonis RTP8]KNY34168.1 RNA-binding protein S4 [Agrobacterium sp. SUL3]KRA56993.1 RNA-binding protein [Rhizobium sp. Root651]MCA2370175.1 RNA-binding S4 domain-containing protein [Agrobacterium tomkonis CIP 111-78]MCD4662457.1 RNA-binding S4 domain-containing protein [Agrobacterium sp.]